MSIELVVICKVCKAKRGPGNGWISVQEDPATGATLLLPFGYGGEHVCTPECGNKLMAEVFERLRGVEKKAPVPISAIELAGKEVARTYNVGGSLETEEERP